MANARFRYALDPVLKRSDWRVNQATRVLAAATTAWKQHQDLHTVLEQEHAEVAGALDRTEGASIDVATRRQALRYLGQTRARLEDSARELQSHADAREAAQRALSEAHGALELLTQHKAESRRTHAVEVARQTAIAADDDWTARHAWQQADSPVEES
ncbi:hypothetical protein [Cupriavidus sp. SW-Y-13]|uniref:hypothetical protein n=1 Tax=Cupriavidus sp. SW-Y-13 TaxID=2653854 RepID=UPI00136610D0|nr:hypothetical protein [Cupriavidus sp. SW-Y-13]MWL90522.1 hypothetical protein [Cupriavidus sp. SW-Y-13]